MSILSIFKPNLNRRAVPVIKRCHRVNTPEYSSFQKVEFHPQGRKFNAESGSVDIDDIVVVVVVVDDDDDDDDDVVVVVVTAVAAAAAADYDYES